jgi:phospholipid transport system substrate-binding protein
MRRFLSLLLLALLAMPVMSAMAATPQEKYIDKLGADVVSLLSDKAMPDAKRREGFGKLLTNNFDLKTIGRFVLGRHWRDATPAQQKEYQSLFEKMVVGVYTQRFSDYSGQQLAVLGSYPVGGSSKDVFVKSEIRQTDGPPLAVEWRIRDHAGKYKIIDAVVEGVSMSVTQRSDFDAVIAAGGIDGLIADLKMRVANASTNKSTVAQK